jgi:DNA-binding SARP family transcriptional activator/TolB-like protein
MRHDQAGREAGLSIRLFGGMAIQDALGADYRPRSRKTRAVVAILAMSAPRPMQRLQVTSLLWSQRETEQARASLRQAVHELQLSLSSAWSRILLAERHTLALDTRRVTVDAVVATEPGAPRLGLLTQLQDGFLEDLAGLDPAFDDWLQKERHRLAGTARAAGEAFLQARNAGSQNIAVARALLHLDASNDTAWRALIRAHIDAGDRAAARHACEQWREAMGLPPEQPSPPELANFLAEIRAGADMWPPVNSAGGVLSEVAEPQTSPDLAEAPTERSRVENRRESLRLGVREMRVIGGDVDAALAAGLAEEITTALCRFRWISCVSGSSLAAMAREAGEANLRWSDIDLDFVLDGTIQRGGDRVRFSARLLDMRAGGTVIWANRFDHEAADTMSVQDLVAAAIVAQLDPVLLMREAERAAARNQQSLSARDLVLQAVPAIYRLDHSSFHAAGDLLEAALRTDPNHTDALAWYSYWHLFLVGQGWAKDPETATHRASQLADVAVALEPHDARALALAGHVRSFLMKRAQEALMLHERALALNPNLAIAWCFSGFAFSYLGDQETALRRMRQAIELSPSDPHSFFLQSALVMPHLLRGEYHEAADAGRRAIELNPWFSSTFKGHLSALGHLARRDEAKETLTRLLKIEPDFTVHDAVRRSPMLSSEDLERYAEGLRLAGLREW